MTQDAEGEAAAAAPPDTEVPPAAPPDTEVPPAPPPNTEVPPAPPNTEVPPAPPNTEVPPAPPPDLEAKLYQSITSGAEKMYRSKEDILNFTDEDDDHDSCVRGYSSKRALMSCGHSVTPQSLTDWCQHQLQQVRNL
ncbi:hypothetical protein WMY93_018988 [Mugilogobius chulae]|uniref:Uncharacterized protein n=1 Tax=Mugilogobius chulae TaxID=88201 RepID=A0AAW0NRY3_9GOBI